MQLKRRSYPKHVPFSAKLPLVLLLPGILFFTGWVLMPEMAYVNGVLEPAEFLPLSFPESGVLDFSRLLLNSTLEQGDLILRRDSHQLEEELVHSEEEKKSAEIHQERLIRELDNLDLGARELQKVTQREKFSMERLVRAGVKSSKEFEDLLRIRQVEGEASVRARNELRKEIQNLDVIVQTNRERSRLLEERIRKSSLVAPYNGKIIRNLMMEPSKPFLGHSPAPGEFCEAGEVLGYFGRNSALRLRLTIPELYRDRAALGLRVTFSPVGYPVSRHRELSGLILSMEPSPQPGLFWAVVEPESKYLELYMQEAGIDPSQLWGLSVTARIELPSRPVLDRWFDL